MKIGYFRADDKGGFFGEIDALGLKIDAIDFCPVKEKQHNGPDFLITTPRNVSHDPFSERIPTYDVGAAWRKLGKNGKPYVAVKLDSPTLPRPILCSLVQQQDGSFALIWTRKADTAATRPSN